jgi:hypothetical protein
MYTRSASADPYCDIKLNTHHVRLRYELSRKNLIGIERSLYYNRVAKRLVYGSYAYRRLREMSGNGPRPKGNLCALTDRYVLVDITYDLHNQRS